ncbi:ADP-ribosyl-[dinitrogen reductase] glycohydrolase [Madurella mycetomatis]|uniref:ADP-ribosyl-[dinitrogen reductase] glycohydrolase n=1 Tax=Madurella mycetomatis TaxID=100816 RepID=A0A175W9P7_9PEZI|nr:ADP-ribosyl-[dinitrogen reductase] glycohydrolase [Madurella mycetomatis]
MSGADPLSSLPQAATAALLRAALQDRTAGVLIGSAVGDAIGLYTEFMSAAHAAAAYPSRTFTLARGPHHSPTPFKLDAHRAPKEPGYWTDDTDHALLLLLGFLHTASSSSSSSSTSSASTAPGGAGSEPSLPLPTQQDFAQRLRVWAQTGLRALETMPLGLGRLVGSVVATAGFADEPERVAREYWERTGRRVAPNGSLMRTHPLGLICLFRAEEEAFDLAARISRVTHVDPRCVLACVIGTGLVRRVVRGEVVSEGDVDASVERAVRWFQEQKDDEGLGLDLEELMRHVNPEGGLDGLKLDEQVAIGYVYKTLGSGVVLLRMAIRRVAAVKGVLLDRSRLFEDLITDLIMCGGDADTNACFAGALLGGYLGYSALPDHWKHGLKHQEWLLGKSDALCRVLGLMDGSYNGKEDADTEVYGGRPILSQDEMEARWMALQQTAFEKMEEAAKASASKVSGSGWSLPWQSKNKAGR